MTRRRRWPEQVQEQDDQRDTGEQSVGDAAEKAREISRRDAPAGRHRPLTLPWHAGSGSTASPPLDTTGASRSGATTASRWARHCAVMLSYSTSRGLALGRGVELFLGFLLLRILAAPALIFSNCAIRRSVRSPSTGWSSPAPVGLLLGCSPSLPPAWLLPVRSPDAAPDTLVWEPASAASPSPYATSRMPAPARETARSRLLSVTWPCAGVPVILRRSSLDLLAQSRCRAYGRRDLRLRRRLGRRIVLVVRYRLQGFEKALRRVCRLHLTLCVRQDPAAPPPSACAPRPAGAARRAARRARRQRASIAPCSAPAGKLPAPAFELRPDGTQVVFLRARPDDASCAAIFSTSLSPTAAARVLPARGRSRARHRFLRDRQGNAWREPGQRAVKTASARAASTLRGTANGNSRRASSVCAVCAARASRSSTNASRAVRCANQWALLSSSFKPARVSAAPAAWASVVARASRHANSATTASAAMTSRRATADRTGAGTPKISRTSASKSSATSAQANRPSSRMRRFQPMRAAAVASQRSRISWSDIA